ncbi:MAG: hypothetical protein WCX69_01895 [Candidatus Paceibacterota bacterium]
MDKYFLKASVLAAAIAGFILANPIFASYYDSSANPSGNNYYGDGQKFTSNSNLRVALIAAPKTGCGPMYGVDLTATIYNYGSYRRDFIYYFDCENDGIWDKTVTSGETVYTANDLCTYANRAVFTARVKVDAGGRTLADTEIIKTNDCGNGNYPNYYQNQYVNPGYYPSVPAPAANGQVSVQKLVSNLSDGTGYLASVNANPLEILSYKIIVAGVSGISRGINLVDALPAAIGNARDLRVDGASYPGNISAGINIGDLYAGQTKIVTFTATVAQASSFPYGQTALTNAATVYAGGASATARATVNVGRSGVNGATSVSTGFDANVFAQLGFAVAAAVMLLFLLARHFLASKTLSPEDELKQKIEIAKRRELV